MALAAAERGFVRDKMNRFERRATRGAWARLAKERIKSGDDREIAGADFAQYHDDPVGFFRDILKIDPWARQADIIRSVADNAQTAAKTGHRIGKSLLAAGLALWWVCTRAEGRVIVTAPSQGQVKNIIWRELGMLHARIKHLVGGEMPLDPMVGLRLSGNRQIIGISTDTPERLAGLAGPSMLFIIDEASGFADALYQAIEGNSAGGEDDEEDADDYETEDALSEQERNWFAEAKILAIGNPTKTSGWFFDIFRTANPDWACFTVSSEESPNITRVANDNGKYPAKVPGLATRSWLLKMQRKYGPDHESHPVYMVRVMGLYPGHAANSVIALSDVEKAQKRGALPWIPKAEGEVTLGVDVARFGDDDSVIASCVDDRVLPLDVFPDLDGPDLAAQVIRVATARRRGKGRVRVNLDGIGVGVSCLDTIIRSDEVREGWLYVVNVQVSERADDEINYASLRSEIWFRCGEWLAAGGALPNDSELSRELLAPTYEVAAKSRLEVASKKAMKKILKKSPDRADAVCLAVYRGRRPAYAYAGVRVDPARQSASGHVVRGGRGAMNF
jgi:phage terminase large subunit